MQFRNDINIIFSSLFLDIDFLYLTSDGYHCGLTPSFMVMKLASSKDLAGALEKWQANSYSITEVTNQHIEQVDSTNSVEGSTTAQLHTNQQTIFSPVPIWEAVSKLQQEQQNLQQQYQTLLDKMSRIEDALNRSQNLNHYENAAPALASPVSRKRP